MVLNNSNANVNINNTGKEQMPSQTVFRRKDRFVADKRLGR